MKEVCHNVTIEPILQPLSGETLHPRSAIVDDNARSDVRAEGFWDCRQQRAYFDVKVFNPTAAIPTATRPSSLVTIDWRPERDVNTKTEY